MLSVTVQSTNGALKIKSNNQDKFNALKIKSNSNIGHKILSIYTFIAVAVFLKGCEGR